MVSTAEEPGSSEPGVDTPAAAESAVSPTAEGPVVLATDNGRLTAAGAAIAATTNADGKVVLSDSDGVTLPKTIPTLHGNNLKTRPTKTIPPLESLQYSKSKPPRNRFRAPSPTDRSIPLHLSEKIWSDLELLSYPCDEWLDGKINPESLSPGNNNSTIDRRPETFGKPYFWERVPVHIRQAMNDGPD